MKRTTLVLIWCFGAFAGTACATTPTAVHQHPDDFRTGTFRIRGTVEQAKTLPATTLTLFLLGDGRSFIPAVSTKTRAAGEEVTLRVRLLGMNPGPTPLGKEEKRILRDALLKTQAVSAPLVDLTVEAVGIGLLGLRAVAGRVYFLLED